MSEIKKLYGGFPIHIIILFILFVIFLCITIGYTFYKKRSIENLHNAIVKDGYMKLYFRLKNGHGKFHAILVDEKLPQYTSEVIESAIFLSPGIHNMILAGKVKDNRIVTNVLPYHTEIKPFEISIEAKKDVIATLIYDVLTQNITLEESEARPDGII